jgi:small subunit ribosomal protein S7
MSRRVQAPRRTVLPDPRFNNEMLARFMNMVMESGKKSVAERIVYGAIDTIADRRKIPAEQAVEVLEQALDNVKPAVEVKFPWRSGRCGARLWRCAG